MKLKLFILKIVIFGFMIPYIGTFIKLYSSGHKIIAFIFVLAISVVIVALEELIKTIKHKLLH